MMRILSVHLFIFAMFFLSVAAGSVFGAGKVVCFDCHEKSSFQNKVIHQPVAESRCSVCHNPHVARYKGLLRSREDKLCYSCHRESEKQFSKGVVHSPVAQGECSSCHKPHASSGKGLINADLAENCFACHTDLKKTYTTTHKPFVDGDCTSCHRPHQADNAELLTAEPDSLCFSCHASDTLQSSHKDYPLAVKNCLSCHNPHGSERKGLMRDFLHEPYTRGCDSCHQGAAEVGMETCLQCHEETRENLRANHSHISLQQGNSCMNCHSPHAGDDKALLKAGEQQVCSSCHSETLKDYKRKSSQHPPVKKCSNCHEPHGSKNLAMLKGGGNAVCIQCHETQGNFTHPVGPEVLESHTGQMVTCVSCHNPMGTDNKYHLIREGKRALCILCHRTY